MDDRHLPYYKWFWQDWRSNRKVIRMNYIERGLYRELLDECWIEGSVPDDIEELADICECPVEVMQGAWHMLSKCFILQDGRWHNEKLESLRTEKDRIRLVRQVAGRSGGLSKAKKIVANAKQNLASDSKCHIEEKRREEKRREEESSVDTEASKVKTRKPKGSRLGTDSVLMPSWETFCKTERPDLVPGIVFSRFKDYWISQPGQRGVKLDWFATWRNWCRNEKLGKVQQTTGANKLDEIKHLLGMQEGGVIDA